MRMLAIKIDTSYFSEIQWARCTDCVFVFAWIQSSACVVNGEEMEGLLVA